MKWEISWRADPRGARIADRHYNRQKVGSPQFVPPGGCVVLVCDGALWVTSTPDPQYVKHAWPGAWINSTFRNERRCVVCGADEGRPTELVCPTIHRTHRRFAPAHLSSELIRQAIAASLFLLGPAPAAGMVSFVDGAKTLKKRDPGRCYRRAGFEHVGFTKEDNLWAFQILPGAMPDPEPPIWGQLDLPGAA